MENTVFANQNDQPPANFNRYAIPVRWGVILGLLLCVLSTIQFMFTTGSYFLFMSFWFITFVISLVFYCAAGFQQRKAVGGYISFKDAFQAIFIMILISVAISTVYGWIYMKFIDPEVMERVKETTVNFMDGVNASQEQIDDAAAQFDKRVEDGKKIGQIFLSYLYAIVIYSIFGFICAAIVKKKKPEFGS